MGLGGFFKKVGKAIEKPFRTGRTQAAQEAQRAAQEQQAAYKEYFDMVKPSYQFGQDQLKSLAQYATPDGLGGLYDELSGSNLATSMIADRTQAADQALSSAGLRRSGTRVDTAAAIPNEVLQGLMSQVIGTTQNTASLGLGQGSTGLGALGGANNAAMNGAQFGMMPSQAKAGVIGGLIQAGGQLGAAALSDARLKTNIQKVGEYGPLNIYQWDWINDGLGMVMNTGFLAQEVQQVYPQHVHPVDVEGFEMLGVDYDGVFQEVNSVH